MSDPNERLEGELARLGAEHVPPVGWEARVLAATEAPPRRRWWLFAVPAFAIAAAVVVVLWMRGPDQPKPLELALAIDAKGPVVRGTEAKVGDTVHATARGGGRYRAVWIYRGDRELIVACPGAASCREFEGAIIADMTVQSPGSYDIVALTSDSPLPVPRGSRDQDVAGALAAGAERKIERLDVQ